MVKKALEWRVVPLVRVTDSILSGHAHTRKASLRYIKLAMAPITSKVHVVVCLSGENMVMGTKE